MRRRAAASVGLAILFYACNHAPTAPDLPGHGPTTQEILTTTCAPVQAEVHCSATFSYQRNSVSVTPSSATWLVTESNLSWNPSAVAVVSAPGVISPLLNGNIAIWIRSDSASATAPHTYAVGPGLPAIELAPYLMGEVVESGGSFIGGALVEIIDGGVDTGKSDVTRAGNGYYFIQHIRMNVPLRVRASKAGYQSVTSDFPGFTDVAGHPEPRSLHFSLVKGF